jgi:hypothetical protein
MPANAIQPDKDNAKNKDNIIFFILIMVR